VRYDGHVKIKNLQTRFLVHAILLGDVRTLTFQVDRFYAKSLHMSDARLKQQLKKFLRQGLLRHIEGTTFRVTHVGLHTAQVNFPYLRSLVCHWDGLWRILSYEIPEVERRMRDALRQRIINWGFGPWHRSFWITPHGDLEYLKSFFEKLPKKVSYQLFEARSIGGSQSELIEKVWGMTHLKKRYKTLYREWYDLLAPKKPADDILLAAFERYIDVLRDDPGLPRQLLPASWEGYKARDLFIKMRQVLLSS
jgi:phenylacetic acid degradation operon negative regulatory protein